MQGNENIPIPRLVNTVATFRVIDETKTPKKKIDLGRLAMILAPRVEYNVKRFAAGIMRTSSPKTTCLIFASGKCVCTGARTEQEARTAAIAYVAALDEAGVDPDYHGFHIENHVAAVDCGFNLDLVVLAATVSGWVSYESNLFPGFVFRETDSAADGTKHNTVAILCFQSGKCVVTGKRDRAAIFTTWKRFFLTALLPNRANVDHGSSGNYRVAQHHKLSLASRATHLEQMTRAVPIRDRSTLRNKSDLVQIQLTRPAALVAIQLVLEYVTTLDLFTTPSEFVFRPAPN